MKLEKELGEARGDMPKGGPLVRGSGDDPVPRLGSSDQFDRQMFNAFQGFP